MGGRLFEVGANSRLSAYSNKYGISVKTWKTENFLCLCVLFHKRNRLVVLTCVIYTLNPLF